MPVPNFKGETFLAFIDFAGFKKLVKNDKNAASQKLDTFYQIIYHILDKDGNNDINGLLVSDCGILFVKEENEEKEKQLSKLLKVVKEINQKMLLNDSLLTTSIAHGDFKYKEKIEFEGIGKNLIHGNAYLEAFLDSESDKAKLRPGECRILMNTLPRNLKDYLNNDNLENIFKFLRTHNRKYYYFYWMLEDPSEIDKIKKEYNKAYESRYTAIKQVLNNYI